MNGRAGYVLGNLILRKHFLGKDEKHLVPLQDLYKICDNMIQVGQSYSSSTKSPSPLMYTWHDSEYMGAAHGLAAILLAYLCVPGYLDQCSSSVQKDIKGSVTYLMSLQTHSGNFPSSSRWIEKPRADKDELVHWCHGASGVVYLMAKGNSSILFLSGHRFLFIVYFYSYCYSLLGIRRASFLGLLPPLW